MVIRSATAADIPAMLELWRKHWKPQDYETNLGTKIEKEPDFVVVADDEGRIVGTVIGGYDLWWAWIYRVAVDPGCQRRGIGKALLDEIGTRFKARGIDYACLIVDPENQRMLGLLRKFRLREHQQRYYSVRFE